MIQNIDGRWLCPYCRPVAWRWSESTIRTHIRLMHPDLPQPKEEDHVAAEPAEEHAGLER